LLFYNSLCTCTTLPIARKPVNCEYPRSKRAAVSLGKHWIIEGWWKCICSICGKWDRSVWCCLLWNTETSQVSMINYEWFWCNRKWNGRKIVEKLVIIRVVEKEKRKAIAYVFRILLLQLSSYLKNWSVIGKQAMERAEIAERRQICGSKHGSL